MISGLRPRGGAGLAAGAAEAMRAVHAQEAGGGEGMAPAPRPLAATEAALASLSTLRPRALDAPGRMLAPGVCVQFRGGAGVRGRIEGLGRGPAPEEGFRLALEDRAESPWFSLEIALPAAPLAAARTLTLRIDGRSETGVASLGPTLRLGHGDGWRDAPFPADLAFTPAPARQLATLSLDELPRRAEAEPVLILFLRQRAAVLALSRIDLMLGA